MSFSPPPFTLRQLQYAVAVADHLSFRRAAEICHVSQPALSAQLAELEAALGVQLFERDKRRTLVTAAGEHVLGRARAILLGAEDLSAAARQLTDPLSGTLRIGVIPTISPYLLPPTVPHIAAAYPRLTVLWLEDKTATLVQHLASGHCDAAVMALEADIGRAKHADIATDRFLLAMPRQHALARKKGPVSLDELQGNRVLLLDEGHCLRAQALSFCTSHHIDELSFRATSLPTLVQMVVAGAGVTLLPELAVASEQARADLVVRPLAEPSPRRTIALVWRPGSPLEPAMLALAGTLRAHYPV